MAGGSRPAGRAAYPRGVGRARRGGRAGRRRSAGRGRRRCARRGVPPALAAAALTQAELRRRAVGKFGPAAAGMFFTRAGLEQATRAVVADRRAARLRAAGVRTLADLGCGLGADALAAARAGIRVYGVEADPLTAALAAANAEAAGLAELVHRRVRATRPAFDLAGVDAVFCDPARRRAGAGRRVFDPTRLLAAVGLRRRAGRAGAAHRAQAGARHRPRAAPARRRGGVGQRRRRPGRGRVLVRPARRGAPPRHPATASAAPRPTATSSPARVPPRRRSGRSRALPVRPGPGGGPRAPGRRVRRRRSDGRARPTRASPTSTPTQPSTPRSALPGDHRRAAVLAQAAAGAAARPRVGRGDPQAGLGAGARSSCAGTCGWPADAAASLVLTRVAGAPTVLIWPPVDWRPQRRLASSLWRDRAPRRRRC